LTDFSTQFKLVASYLRYTGSHAETANTTDRLQKGQFLMVRKILDSN